jgi:hypothetical protein
MIIFYVDRDNNVGFVCLNEDGEVVDLSGVTRAVVSANEIEIDSAISDKLVVQQEQVEWRGSQQTLWVIRLRLGLVEAMTEGRYQVRITLYSPDWPNGMVVANGINVRVIE